MGKRPKDSGPPERTTTVREALRRELALGPRTARDLSAAASIREKDVAAHLEHLARSIESAGGTFVIRPAACLACGFEFKTRKRLTTPGRCPECASERIDPPTFEIAAETP